MDPLASPGASLRRSPLVMKRDLGPSSPPPSPAPNSAARSGGSSLTNNPQFGIWQKKAQATAREQARWQVGLLAFGLLSVFFFVVLVAISYNDPKTAFEITGKETRLVEVSTDWYSSVTIEELRGEIMTYSLHEKPSLVTGPPLDHTEKFSLSENQLKYFARYLHEGSTVAVKIKTSKFDFTPRDKLGFTISKGTQSLNNGYNGVHVETFEIMKSEFSFSYSVDASDDFYFIFERISLDAAQIDASETFEGPEDVTEDGPSGGRLDGEISFQVVPKVYDITYAKDWERGSVVKDFKFREPHFLVITNPSLNSVAMASLVFQDREFFLFVVFLFVEAIQGVVIVLVMNRDSILECLPRFGRPRVNSRIRGMGMESISKK